MMAAYSSGDPYLVFAKQAGAIPPDGTKATHGPIREQYKQCCLVVQYGMEAESLAIRIGQPTAQARHLLQTHRRAYSTFWQWSDSAVDHAMLKGYLYTVFGWTIHVGSNSNPRSLRNFPMQGNGAEMLRLACVYATEQGIRICAPVHDALLIEAPLGELEQAVRDTQRPWRTPALPFSMGLGYGRTLRSFAIPIAMPMNEGSTCGIPCGSPSRN